MTSEWKVLAMVFSSLLLASCATGANHPTAAVQPQSTASQADSAIPDVIDRSLPGVVLLLNWRSDGKTGFGAGILLDNNGLVLTNLHVAANANSLGVLFYKPDRVSYMPSDGGLARYIFENNGDIVPATLVRGDPILDIAILRVAQDTTRFGKLAFRTQPVRRGERMLSLGHPQETVWSFTAGIVSAIHHAAIQHDAPISTGNSGGPLIDTQGRIAGINTSKLTGTGFGFALPIGMAQLLIDGATAPFQPDLSTVENAFNTCARALELHSPSVLKCHDWDRTYDLTLRSLNKIRSKLQLSDTFAEILEQKMKGMGREQWVDLFKRAKLAELKGEDTTQMMDEFGKRVATLKVASEPADAVRAESERNLAIAQLRTNLTDPSTFATHYDEALFKRTGLKLDSRNPRARDELMKMGIRLEKSKQIDSEHAWLAISGRNLDGTVYRYAEYWIKLDIEWKKREPPFPEEVATLPPQWPPPISDYEETLEILARHIEIQLKRSTGSRQ
jgi:hypothetical protein